MDERIAELERQKAQALQNSNNTYGDMLQDNQNLYDKQYQLAEDAERTQNELLDKQLAYNEQVVNRNKEEARKNMETEQKKARNDYLNYINPYGAQAEALGSQGLLNSGVSGNAQMGAYTIYQNRNATANKVMQDAFVQYDDEMAQARLNHDSNMAQNALAKLQAQMDALKEFTQNKNSITQQQLTNNQNIDSEYYGRYSDEYNRYQEELARQEAIRQWEAEMAEQQRQYNENLAYQREQAQRAQQQWEQQMAYQKEQDRLAQQQWQKEYELQKKAYENSAELEDNRIIETDYWNGPINKDVKYGTFGTKDKNGVEYQPDNYEGKKLSKSGYKVKDIFGTGKLFGETGASLDNQTIWQTKDGKYYIWDGSQNKYFEVQLVSRVR